jgi:predicted short-subunit dehydrogenase-like oxidoreductase (DUF2520 family)
MRRHNNSRSGVAIIGPGRVGQALGRLLAQSRVPIAYVGARRLARARQAGRFIRQGKPLALAGPELMRASVFLLTTSDSALARVAEELASQGSGKEAWRGKVVLHTCGSLPSAVLRPLKLRGAAIGSLHPYQTVPSPQAGVRNLRGCFWGIEGDPQALQVARRWVKLLKGVAFRIHPKKKTLYHLSAFLVSPTLVTLMEQSTRLLRKAGVPPGIARPMLRQFVTETTKNFAEIGARRALTGPAVRGDWPTIRRHLAALERAAPRFVPVYETLLQAMLRLVGRKAPRRLWTGGRRAQG